MSESQVGGLSRVSLIFAYVSFSLPCSIYSRLLNSCGTALFSDGTYCTYYPVSCALSSFITRLLQQCHWNGYVHPSFHDLCYLNTTLIVTTRETQVHYPLFFLVAHLARSPDHHLWRRGTGQ